MVNRPLHAEIRFGWGCRGTAALHRDPRNWLAGQLDGPDAAMARPWHSAAEGLRAIRLDQQDKDGKQAYVRPIITAYAPFRDRLVWFWANHLTVSLRRGQLRAR